MGHGIIRFHPTFQVQSSLSEDTVIYHIFSFEYFKALLESRSLYFKRIVEWYDTYEYPVRFMPEDRKELIVRYLFGICFAQQYDKEAMWKLYAGDDYKTGVCVKTTVKRVYDAIKNYTEHEWRNGFVAKVKYVPYLDDEPAKMFFESDKTTYPDYMYPAFIKRDAFSYEDEIRIMIFDPSRAEKGQIESSINVPVDLSFIDGIILSPYFPSDKKEEFYNLCNKQELNVPITQSTLFQKLAENIKPLPEDNLVFWGGPKRSITNSKRR